MGPSDILRLGMPNRGIGRVSKSLMPPMISIFSSVVNLPRIDSTRLSTLPCDGVDWAKPNCAIRTRAVTAVSLFVMLEAIRPPDRSPQDLSSVQKDGDESPSLSGQICFLSETHAQSQLQVAPINGDGSERRRPHIGLTHTRRTAEVCTGRSVKARVIEYVLRIGTKLNLDTFLPGNGKTLGRREIENIESGTVEAIPSHVPEGSIRRFRKCCYVNPVRATAGARSRAHPWN